MAEMRRAERLAKISEDRYIQRVKKSEPNAVQARLVVELAENWQEQVRLGKIGLHVSVDYEGARKPASDVPTDVPFSFTSRDENILYVLEDICGGPVQSDMFTSTQDFINV